MALQAFLTEYRAAGSNARALQEKGVSEQTLHLIKTDAAALHPTLQRGLLKVYAKRLLVPPRPSALGGQQMPMNLLDQSIFDSSYFRKMAKWRAQLDEQQTTTTDNDAKEEEEEEEEDQPTLTTQKQGTSAEKRRKPNNDANTASPPPDWESLPTDVADLIRRHNARQGVSEHVAGGLDTASMRFFAQYKSRISHTRERIAVGPKTNLLPTRVHLALIALMSRWMRGVRLPRYHLQGHDTEASLGFQSDWRRFDFVDRAVVDARAASVLNSNASVSFGMMCKASDSHDCFMRPLVTVDLTSPETDRLCVRADHWAAMAAQFDDNVPHLGLYHTTTSLGLDRQHLASEATQQRIERIENDEVDESDSDYDDDTEQTVYVPWSGESLYVDHSSNGSYVNEGVADPVFEQTPQFELWQLLVEANKWSSEVVLYDVRLDPVPQQVYDRVQRALFTPTLEQMLRERRWQYQQGVLLARSMLSPPLPSTLKSPRDDPHPMAAMAAAAVIMDRIYPFDTRTIRYVGPGDDEKTWLDWMKFPEIADSVATTLRSFDGEFSELELSRNRKFAPMLHGHAEVYIHSSQMPEYAAETLNFVDMPPEHYRTGRNQWQMLRDDATRQAIRRTVVHTLVQLDKLLDGVCRVVVDVKDREKFKQMLASCFAVTLLPTRLAYTQDMETTYLQLLEEKCMWGPVWFANDSDPLDHPGLLPHTRVFINGLLMEELEKPIGVTLPSNVYQIDVYFGLEKFSDLFTGTAVEEALAFESMLWSALKEWRDEAEAQRRRILDEQMRSVEVAAQRESREMIAAQQSWWRRWTSGKPKQQTKEQGQTFDLERYLVHRGNVFVPDPNVLAVPGLFTFTLKNGEPFRIPAGPLEGYEFEFIERLGAGVSGVTYHTCMHGTCGYAMKIGQIADREVQTAVFMGHAQVGPLVITNFELPDTDGMMRQALVMERVDMTLQMWLASGRKLTAEHADAVDKLLARAWNLHFVHGDLKVDNFGVNIERDGLDYRIREFFLIDFGTSFFEQVDGPYDPRKRRGGWLKIVPLLVDFEQSTGEHALLGTNWDRLVLLYNVQVSARRSLALEFSERLADLCYNQYSTKTSGRMAAIEDQTSWRRDTRGNLRRNPFDDMRNYMQGLSRIQVIRLNE